MEIDLNTLLSSRSRSHLRGAGQSDPAVNGHGALCELDLDRAPEQQQGVRRHLEVGRRVLGEQSPTVSPMNLGLDWFQLYYVQLRPVGGVPIQVSSLFPSSRSIGSKIKDLPK